LQKAELSKLRFNREAAEEVKRVIWKLAERFGDRTVKLMNFCGTHEWTTVHFGLRSLMPPNVELVAGPGCPVCVTPSHYIEQAIKLSMEGVTVYSFGDAFKLPALRRVRGARSLEEAKALGGDVEIVYGFLDAIKKARESGREGVFLGIGFETTTPSYSVPFFHGKVPENLYFLSVLRLTPPAADYAIKAALDRGLTPVQGIIAPGHVSTIIGAKPWSELAEKYRIPAVVSGFEPLDVLLSIAMLLRMILEKEYKVEIEYKRLVTWEGNTYVQQVNREIYRTVDAAWRGLGFIPESGLELREKYSRFDAFTQFGLDPLTPEKWSYDLPAACRCADITLGLAVPTDCPMFKKACTPERPIGPCMVSLEGTCAVWARFGGGGLAEEIAREIGV